MSLRNLSRLPLFHSHPTRLWDHLQPHAPRLHHQHLQALWARAVEAHPPPSPALQPRSTMELATTEPAAQPLSCQLLLLHLLLHLLLLLMKHCSSWRLRGRPNHPSDPEPLPLHHCQAASRRRAGLAHSHPSKILLLLRCPCSTMWARHSWAQVDRHASPRETRTFDQPLHNTRMKEVASRDQLMPISRLTLLSSSFARGQTGRRNGFDSYKNRRNRPSRCIFCVLSLEAKAEGLARTRCARDEICDPLAVPRHSCSPRRVPYACRENHMRAKFEGHLKLAVAGGSNLNLNQTCRGSGGGREERERERERERSQGR